MIQRFQSVRENLLAVWKLALSFRKKNWDLGDYPIVIRKQSIEPVTEETAPRGQQYRYLARVVKWWTLSAGGDTAVDAMRKLVIQFDTLKLNWQREGKPLPRPGTFVPIQFASQERVNAHIELKEDFVRRVLGLDWAFISDGSSLWDFHTNNSNDELHTKIAEVYRADVSDIESGNLADILERIAAGRS